MPRTTCVSRGRVARVIVVSNRPDNNSGRHGFGGHQRQQGRAGGHGSKHTVHGSSNKPGAVSVARVTRHGRDSNTGQPYPLSCLARRSRPVLASRGPTSVASCSSSGKMARASTRTSRAPVTTRSYLDVSTNHVHALSDRWWWSDAK